MKKKALGKGLEALFNENEISAGQEKNNEVINIGILSVDPSLKQARKQFNKEKLKELAESIVEHGIIQPIVVRKNGDRYEIIAGERRWRAARMAGLKTVTVLVKITDEKEASMMALIENLQREDLNPMEEARGIRAMMKEYAVNQDEIGKTLGKSRSQIANIVRLLNLPEEIQGMLERDEISTGHAKVLLSIKNEAMQKALAENVRNERLSVRQLEEEIRELEREKKTRAVYEKPAYIEELERKIAEFTGTKVNITRGRKKGKVEIEYYSNDDLERIIDLLSR